MLDESSPLASLKLITVANVRDNFEFERVVIILMPS